MDIDETLVRHVAKLARLQLTDEEVAGIAPQLTRIFAHVDQVCRLDVEGADPATQAPIPMEHLRDDVAGDLLDPQAILRNAPAHDGAFLVVPRFFDGTEGEA
jgi:aspartyl-tRNA(Asn)/glutamyl-tRNA(Gln) amidotransferase subunit C